MFTLFSLLPFHLNLTFPQLEQNITSAEAILGCVQNFFHIAFLAKLSGDEASDVSDEFAWSLSFLIYQIMCASSCL